MGRTFLITGGAGFIGSNYVEFHLNKYPEDEVIVLDKLTYAGRKENLKEFESNSNFEFVKGDICNKKLVEKLVKDVDVVINFAAETMTICNKNHTSKHNYATNYSNYKPVKPTCSTKPQVMQQSITPRR